MIQIKISELRSGCLRRDFEGMYEIVKGMDLDFSQILEQGRR